MEIETRLSEVMGSAWVGRLATLLVYGVFALTLVLIWFGSLVEVSYENPWMTLLLNTLLITGVSAWGGALALRGYLASGLPEMLYAGSGLVAMGSSFLLSSLIIGAAQGPNDAVTVHNLGVFCAAFFHLAASLHAGQPRVGKAHPTAFKAASAYLGVLALTGFLWAAAQYDLAPDFYVPGRGTTPVRQLVLIMAVALLAVAAAFLIRHSTRRGSLWLRFYGLGLGLVGMGLVDVFIAVPGSILSWTGRLSQSFGQLYLLAAFMVAIRTAAIKGLEVKNVVRDVTARKRAEDALRNRDLRIRQALLVRRSFAFEWNPITDEVTRSEECGPLLGLNGDEAIHDSGENFIQRVHPDDRERLVAILRELTPDSPSYIAKYRLVRPDGQVTTLEETGRGTFDVAGRLAHLTGITTDVTDREKAQAETSYLATFPSLNPNPIVEADPDGHVRFRNPAAAELFPDLPQRGKDHPWLSDWSSVSEILGEGFQHRVEREVAIGGKWYYQTLHFIPGSRSFRIYGVDITGLQEAKQALRSSEEANRKANAELEETVRKRTLELEDTVAMLKNEIVVRKKIQTQLHHLSRVFMDAADPVIIEDLSGTVVEMNREAEAVYGWGREELIGKPVDKLFLPERHQIASHLREQCCAGQEIRNHESIRKAKSGRIIPSLLTAFPLTDESGKVAFVATICKDISARKEMEVRLNEAQRHLKALSRKSLEALEADRRSVARELHDSIGGSLAAIKFGLEEVAGPAVQDPVCGSALLGTLIGHLADTIKETKRISANLRPLTIDDLGLLATIEWYTRQFGQRYEDIRLVRQIEVEEHEIPEDYKIVVYRIMQEALTNAAKHSKADTIHIRLKKDAGHLELEVEDNGCGFTLRKAFESGDGLSGYGLRGMQERVEICGGSISIRSRPGEGTQIKAHLPVSEILFER